MDTFLTTTTGPPWTFTIKDKQGNVLPGFVGATFTLTFRSTTTLLKATGQGLFGAGNATTGQVVYTLHANDLATAYALASNEPGTEIFEIFVGTTIGSLVYDDAAPVTIGIRKI